jgi:hypothetical protein
MTFTHWWLQLGSDELFKYEGLSLKGAYPQLDDNKSGSSMAIAVYIGHVNLKIMLPIDAKINKRDEDRKESEKRKEWKQKRKKERTINRKGSGLGRTRFDLAFFLSC